MIKERLRAYRNAGVITIRAGLPGRDLTTRLEALGSLVDLVSEVDV
jgi:hypothetical protein